MTTFPRLAYLGSPYTHRSKRVRHQRYLAACKVAAKLMEQGEVVFAPIPHSHPIELHMKEQKSGEFWKRQDSPYLEVCDKLYVLMLDGWDRSAGLAHEIRRAVERGIPVVYLEP